MKKDKERWKDEILSSMKGSKRAKPAQDLFQKIENQLERLEYKIISIKQWNIAAAIAIVLICTNGYAFYSIDQSQSIAAENNIEVV
ncbi:MAG: hypothetical protein AAGK97_04890, partial [Bacteroidota bacterium]